MRICTIIGVRPQFVKAAVLSPVIRKEHEEILIHTGQHYDDNMSAVFFRELGLPVPDYLLKANEDCTIEDRIERMTSAVVSVLQREQPDAVLVYGDTNTTLAGVLAADRLKIPAIHVEAGERNGLDNNPEEQIRKRVDHLSSLLLCCSNQAVKNLQKEGLGDRAHYIGNLMEMSFLKNIEKPWKPKLVRLCEVTEQVCISFVSRENMERENDTDLLDKTVAEIPDKYFLLTCHRQENTNEKNLTEILLAMEQVKYPVIFPVHPRNKERVLKLHREFNLSNNIFTEPVGYFDSIHLIKNAVAVVTDSGGVLQEAHFARTPYVFVLDIAKVPVNTRFDASRLVRPRCQEIVAKIKEHQEFAINQAENVQLEEFEDRVLQILRRFEKQIRVEVANGE